jgi:PAS domain S-box-containing protein
MDTLIDELLLNSQPAGLFIQTDLQFNIISSGAADHTIEHTTLLNLFTHEQPIVQELLERCVRQKQPLSANLGLNKNIKITLSPLFKFGKDIDSLLIHIQLTTAPEEPTDKITLEILKDRFHQLFELNPASISISRVRDGKIINVNQSFLTLFEFEDKAEVIGKTSIELNLLVDPGERLKVKDILPGDKKNEIIEMSVRTHRGNLKWVTSSLIKMEFDGEICFMTVTLDITKRKEAENEVRELNHHLNNLVLQRSQEIQNTEIEYRTVVEQATDGIFISDTNGKYIEVNPKACAMLGYSREELLQMSTYDLLNPEEAVVNPPKFSELMKGKTILSTRNLRRKDGTIMTAEINARMLSNGRMLGMVRDVTERKKAEDHIRKMNDLLEEQYHTRTKELENKARQLIESEEKFKKAFYASSAGMTMTRLSDGIYVDVNEAFLKLIGYEKEEVIHHTAHELKLLTDLEKTDEVYKILKEQGSVKQVEMRMRTKTGQYVDILSSIETILSHGELYAINIIYDITKRKQAESQLAAVNKELEAFSYSVSHDLRAPLRSIVGFSELMREHFGHSINAEVNRYLHTIQRNATKMSRLIDDLLAFSKAGKQELIKTRFETTPLVDSIIDDHLSTWSKPAQVTIHPLHPSYGDFSLLNQVWINLISNASKYSSKKENPEIEVGSYLTEEEVIFFVRDNGAGFKMEYADKLFGVFQRLHHAKEFEGTGVGLALVKRIVERHGGRTWGEGKINEGSTFYFSLPRVDLM